MGNFDNVCSYEGPCPFFLNIPDRLKIHPIHLRNLLKRNIPF
jgi:hypothetical protein